MSGLNAKEENGVRLNEQQAADLFDCYYKIPQLQKAANKFIDMIADCVPVISAPSLQDSEQKITFFDKNFDFVYRNKWSQWVRDVYVFLYIFGICPWRKVKFGTGSLDYYPEVMMYGSGYIRTWADKEDRQRFSWHSTNGDQLKNVYFATRGAEPNLDGTFRSPLMSLLPDFIYMKHVRRNLKVAVERQGHPEGVFESNPPRNVTGDDDLQLLAKWPDEIVGSVIRDRSKLRGEKMRLNLRQVKQQVEATRRQNALGDRLGTLIDMGTSESLNEQYDRYRSNRVAQAYPLPPYTTYKPVAPPKIDVDLLKIQQRLSEEALALMELPSSLFSSSSSNKSSIASANEIKMVNESLKYWKNYFETLILKAILVIHRDYIYKKFEDLQRRRGILTDANMVELVAEVDIKVELPCASYTNLPTLFELFERQLLSPKQLKHYVSETTGIPEDHLEVPPKYEPPEKAKAARPRAEPAKRKADPAETKRRKIEKDLG